MEHESLLQSCSLLMNYHGEDRMWSTSCVDFIVDFFYLYICAYVVCVCMCVWSMWLSCWVLALLWCGISSLWSCSSFLGWESMYVGRMWFAFWFYRGYSWETALSLRRDWDFEPLNLVEPGKAYEGFWGWTNCILYLDVAVSVCWWFEWEIFPGGPG